MEKPNKSYLYYPVSAAYTVASMIVGCVVLFVFPPASGAPWPSGFFFGPVFGWALVLMGSIVHMVLGDIYGSYRCSKINYEKKLQEWRDEEYLKSVQEQQMAKEWLAKKEKAA